MSYTLSYTLSVIALVGFLSLIIIFFVTIVKPKKVKLILLTYLLLWFVLSFGLYCWAESRVIYAEGWELRTDEYEVYYWDYYIYTRHPYPWAEGLVMMTLLVYALFAAMVFLYGVKVRGLIPPPQQRRNPRC